MDVDKTQSENTVSESTADLVSHSDDDDIQSAHGSTILAGKNKMLVINRLVKNENGEPVWKSEVVTDTIVINAYLRHRRQIEKPQVVKEDEVIETDLKARIKRRFTNTN